MFSMRYGARRYFWLGFGGLALLALLASVFFYTQKLKQPVAPIPVRLALPMQLGSGLLMIAQTQGYFAAHGLEMEIHQYPSGKRALQDSFFKGQSDIAASTDVPVALAALNGQAFQIIATLSTANNVNRILARRTAGITQVADLVGKRIATQKNSAMYFFLHLFLLEHGISEEQVQLVFMEPEQLPQALADGKVDAISMREPFISEAIQLLGSEPVLFQAAGIYNQVDALLVNPSWSKAHPEAVQRFLQALVQAQQFVHEHPQQARLMISQYLGVAPESLEQNWSTYIMRVMLTQSSLLLLEDIARWAIAEGMVTSSALPDFLTLFNPQPLLKVAPEAVAIIH